MTAVYEIPVAQLRPNPKNPRRDIGDINDLTDSIRERGVLQPVLAMREPGGGVTVLARHRRLEACKRAGRATIPVLLVGDQLPDDQLVLALTENLHRAQLAPMDEARACKALLDMGRSRQNVAVELSRSGNWVADRLALLELPKDMQRLVDAGELPIGKASDLGKKLARRQGGSVTVGARATYHFTRAHPLASTVTARCDDAGHHINGRFGGTACGVCWEAAIREDERARRVA